jgi:hypothetical protein
MRYDINPKQLSWTNRNGGGSFTPRGKLVCYGDAQILANPRRWESADTYSARIVVGFRPKDAPPDFEVRDVGAKEDQLVNLVRRIRTKQVGDPGATFLAQRGLYRHSESGEVVDEPGMQILLINTTGETPRRFERQVEILAELIVEAFDQEEVIVEIQKNGVSQKVFGIGQ